MAGENLREYQIDECEDVEEVVEEVSCPSCVEDPSFVEPDWRSLKTRTQVYDNSIDMNLVGKVSEAYLNNKTCEYTIVARSKYEGTGGEESLQDRMDESLESAVRGLLRYYNKIETDGDEGTVSAILAVASAVDYHIQPRKNLKMKVKVVVPAFNFDQIESASDEEEESEEGADIVVTYNSIELRPLILSVASEFRLYNFYQAFMEKKEGSYVVFSDTGHLYDFDLQRTLLGDFLRQLNEFLNSKGYAKVKSFHLGGTNRTIRKKIPETLEFGFTQEYKLKYIKITAAGCPDQEKFNVQKGQFPFSEACFQNATTMAYVASLREMDMDIRASDPLPWDEIATQYTYPAVKINYGDGVDSSNGTEELSALGCLVDSIRQDRNIFSDVVSLSEALTDTWNELLCMTAEEKEKFREEVESNDDILMKIVEETSLREFNPDETPWGNWGSIVENAPDVDVVKYYWNEIFGEVGVCGILSLLKEAINCLVSGLSYEEALRTVITSRINSLNTRDFGRLTTLIPASLRSSVEEQVKSQLVLGEIVTWPWDNEEAQYSDYMPESEGLDYGDQNSVLGVQESIQDQEILETYKTELLNSIQTIEDLDQFIEFLGRLPGAKLLFDLVREPNCVMPTVKNLPIKGCPDINFELTVPFSRIYGFTQRSAAWWNGKDPFEVLGRVSDRFEEVLVKVLVRIINKVMKTIKESPCELIAASAELAKDGEGSFSLREALSSLYCGEEADEEEIDSTIESLLSSIADTSSEQLTDAVEVAVGSLNETEAVQLLLGEAKPEVYESIVDIIGDNYPELTNVFANELQVRKFFRNIGSFFPVDMKRNMRNATRSLPVSYQPATICATKEQLFDLSNAYPEPLTKDGTTQEQADAQFNDYRESIKQDLLELSDILNNGIEGAVTQELLDSISDSTEECLTESATIDSEVLNVDYTNTLLNQSIVGFFKTIERNFDRDLIGRKGFLNMVLSDTNALPWLRHKRKSNRRRKYVDHPALFEEGFLNIAEPFGFYPETVALWLREQITKIIPTVLDPNLGTLNDPALLFVSDSEPQTTSCRRVEMDSSLTIAEAFSLSESDSPLQPEKNHDISFCFRDNNNGQFEDTKDILYGYGFDIEYSHYVVDTALLPVLSDIAKIKIIDLNVERAITRWGREYVTEDVVCEIDVTGSLPQEAYGVINFSAESDLPPQANAFLQFLEEAVLEYSLPGEETNVTDSFREQLMNSKTPMTPSDEPLNIYDKTLQFYLDTFLRKISDSENSAFKFGFNLEDDITSDDLVYYKDVRNVRAQGLHYDENLTDEDIYGEDYSAQGFTSKRLYLKYLEKNKVLGVSATPRVHFMSPDDYGGRFVRPPIYIEPREDDGWLGLSKVLVPELDACDPKSPDLVDFSDIAAKVEKIHNNMKEDSRTDMNPDCVLEKPYFRIFERMPAAGLEGAVMSTIRVHVAETMLKSIATFTKYDVVMGDIVDDLFVDYIISQIENDLRDQGRKIRNPINLLKGENYFYCFLEQAVQIYRRRYLEGDVEITSDIEQAVNNIDSKLAEYEVPTKKSFRKAKSAGETDRATFRKYKQDKIVEFLKDTEENAKVMMRTLVQEQVSYMANQFKAVLDKWRGDGELIDNLEDDLFDVVELGGVPADLTYKGAGVGTFIFEKYINVEAKAESTFPSPPPTGVTSLSEFESWLSSVNSDSTFDNSQLISDLFGELSTITDTETEDILGVDGTIGLRYGLRITYIRPDTAMQTINLDGEKASTLAADEERIPIASVEIDILDGTIEGLNVSSGEDGYNLECLKQKLKEEPKYIALFKYAIPLPRLLSLCVIYNSKAFLPSIGQKPTGTFVKSTGDSWSEGEGILNATSEPLSQDEWQEDAFDSRGLNWYKWDQESFDKSKRTVRKMFVSFWNYREPFDFNFELNAELSGRLRDLMSFNFDGTVLNWFLRRRIIDRPFNKDDEECE